MKPAYLVPLVLLTAAVLAMEGHHMASSVNESELEPVAHRAHHHGVPILETELYPEERKYWEAYNTTTFFTAKGANTKALVSHVVLMGAAIVFLYPVALVLQNIKSNWYLPALTVHLAAVIISLVCLAVFGSSVPDMYPGNAYRPMTYILLVGVAVHYVSAILNTGINWLSKEEDTQYSFIPMKNYAHKAGGSSISPSSTLFDFQNFNQEANADRTFSIDSPNDSDYTSRNSEMTVGRIPEEGEFSDPELAGLVSAKKSSLSVKRDTVYGRLFHNKIIQGSLKRFGKIATFIFKFLNYAIFFFYLVYAPTGIAVGNMMGQGSKVFNLLAHFIKGGVFFLIGLVSLARYCGCWQEQGFAWNMVKLNTNEKQLSPHFLIRKAPKGLFTMEFIESFLIFFYGSTNVFMEHMANSGGAWAAKDLQHVSIAFMYIGGGLCGLITEFSLSQWRFRKAMQEFDNNRHPNKQIQYATPGFSPNPFPVFTIFWTGILMSQHAQASPVSTNIHQQWGYLLSFGSLFRLVTYALCLFSKPSKYESKQSVHQPSRPFTELLVASALLCGGVIFMESTDQCVDALEYRGLTPMFTLNVSVGSVALLMGWVMTVLFLKQWLKKRT